MSLDHDDATAADLTELVRDIPTNRADPSEVDSKLEAIHPSLMLKAATMARTAQIWIEEAHEAIYSDDENVGYRMLETFSGKIREFAQGLPEPLASRFQYLARLIEGDDLKVAQPTAYQLEIDCGKGFVPKVEETAVPVDGHSLMGITSDRAPGFKELRNGFYPDHYSALLLVVAEYISYPYWRPPGDSILPKLSDEWTDAYYYIVSWYTGQENRKQERPHLEDWADDLFESVIKGDKRILQSPQRAKKLRYCVLDALSTAERGEIEGSSNHIAVEMYQAAKAEVVASWGGYYQRREWKDDWVFVPLVDAPATGRVWTMAHVRSKIGDDSWQWKQWLVKGHLTTLAGEPGHGKSFVALDLARRFWFGEPMPDGSASSVPAGTRTIWIPTDRNPEELAKRMAAFGLPDEAIVFNGQHAPLDSLNLDDPATVARLGVLARDVKPAMVVIDTVNRASHGALSRPEEAAAFFDPLLDQVARPASTAILALTHLSKGGEPLDRRIEGISRVMMKLEEPDKARHAGHRRLWVEKTNDTIPEPLGVRFTDGGAVYDTAPPSRPGPGRKNDSAMKAADFLQRYLGDGQPHTPKQVKDAAKQERIALSALTPGRELAGVEIREGKWLLS